MRWLVCIVVCIVAGCLESTPDREPAPVKTEPVATPEPQSALPPLAETTRSFRITKTILVRLGPGDTTPHIGTIAPDTRVRWKQRAVGSGCVMPWIEMAPRGWICGDYAEESEKPPSGVELPRLARGELVPGVFGKMKQDHAPTWTAIEDGTLTEGPNLVGSVNVRRFLERSFGGRMYWKISPREEQYVPASEVSPYEPSSFAGQRLGDEIGWALPLAFVVPRSGDSVLVQRDGQPGRKLPRRDIVRVLEKKVDGEVTQLRIGDGEWIDARDARLAEVMARPPTVAATERWVDVDTSQQTLVAYEGDVPVYVTLVSSGAKATPTQPGLYRMWKKISETDMRDLQAESPYSVATVPWTQFFEPRTGLALHTSYWHDKFGTGRSHGCVNLAPIDARWLYFWTDPQVPPGWTMSGGVFEAPGSVVRVRHGADVASLQWIGYGKRVAEARSE